MDRRKTQQNAKDNAKDNATSRPSSRISRLVQPRKYTATPHTLNKNRSSSTENLASSLNLRTNKRSLSATPHITSETPSRPPFIRSLSVAFTPASNSKNVVHKKPMSEQAIRVLTTLRKHFGDNFLLGGLQSMSTKQFVEIIKFFAQSIYGDKIVIQDNSVDYVKHVVDFLEYPHKMNRSWFQVPTVSIAYERNVEFMDWLCDHISTDDQYCSASIVDFVENEDNAVDESNIFPNQKCISTFLGDVRKGFERCDDRGSPGFEVRFEEFKLQTRNMFIGEKTQIDNITALINQVKSEYESLLSKEYSFRNDNLLLIQQEKGEELKAEVSQLKAEVTQLKISVNEKDFQYQKTCRESNELTAKNTESKSTIDELKLTIKNQPMSIDDRQKVTIHQERKTHFAKEKRIAVDSLKALVSQYEEKITTLKMHKVSKVFAFNSLIQKLFHNDSSFDDITMNQLAIDENSTKDRTKEVFELFRKIKEIINKRRADVRISLNATQIKLSSAKDELFKNEDELGAQKKQLHTLEVQMQKFENEIVHSKYNSEEQQLQTQINNLLYKAEQIELKIKNSEKVGVALKEENKKIYQGIELKGNALLAEKEARQVLRAEAIAELECVTKKLTEAVKNLK